MEFHAAIRPRLRVPAGVRGSSAKQPNTCQAGSWLRQIYRDLLLSAFSYLRRAQSLRQFVQASDVVKCARKAWDHRPDRLQVFGHILRIVRGTTTATCRPLL